MLYQQVQRKKEKMARLADLQRQIDEASEEQTKNFGFKKKYENLILCTFKLLYARLEMREYPPHTATAAGAAGCLRLRRLVPVRRGQALHELDPVFKKFSFSESVASLFSSLGYKRPAVIQSMYIFKQPGIGGEVVPHQDNTFLYTEPRTCTGLWLALEDATINNGCLWAIPGSHKKGLVRRMVRDENGTHFDRPSPVYDQKEFVPLEVKSGALVVIHGDLIHQSFENLSPASRHAFSLHVVDTEGCKWSEDNWRKQATPTKEASALYAAQSHLVQGESSFNAHTSLLARDKLYDGEQPLSAELGEELGKTQPLRIEVPVTKDPIEIPSIKYIQYVHSHFCSYGPADLVVLKWFHLIRLVSNQIFARVVLEDGISLTE
ncbi:hypothetical protein ACJX0J_007408, partial [Zea mays]